MEETIERKRLPPLAVPRKGENCVERERGEDCMGFWIKVTIISR